MLAGLPVMLVLTSPAGLRSVKQVVADRRSLQVLALSTALISINWFVFIYAVVSNRLVEASLGYFINPLVSVLLGRLFLGERLRPLQLAAIGIAIAGVGVFGWSTVETVMGEPNAATGLLESWNRVPWIALALPVSFGCYGLLRKKMKADSITGLTVEMGLLLPIMLVIEIWLATTTGVAFLNAGVRTDLFSSSAAW